MPDIPTPDRDEVWLVSLDPTVCHEVKKTRPAVVVSSDLYNRYNWVVTVVPLTSRTEAEYDQVLIVPREEGVNTASVTLPDQIRAVDRRRLVKRLGCLNDKTIDQLNRSLKIVLDIL